MVETVLIFGLLFGLIWLAWNVCWALFATASMQLAVTEAARAGVTGQLQWGAADLKNTMAQVAEHTAPAFLTPHLACQTLSINFFDQSGNAVSAPVDLGIVSVTVQNYPYTMIAPIFAMAKGQTVIRQGSAGAQIFASASGVSQSTDPLNPVAVGTWPPATCP